tara:strand:- start:2264 stop:2677 length:414 start_codon:yes stop_codon:yes gene_type:complete
MSNEILGVVFPLSPEQVNNLFKGHNIFIKFAQLKNKKNKLTECNRFFIYQTKSNKEIIGEATISKVEFLNFKEISKKYSFNEICNIENEFMDYIEGREHAKMLVMVLSNPKKYKNPIKLKKRLSLSYIYLKKELIKE